MSDPSPARKADPPPGSRNHPEAGSPRRPSYPAYQEAEQTYREISTDALSRVQQIGTADITIGISFGQDAGSAEQTVETVIQGLTEFYPDQKAVILVVGSAARQDALESITHLSRKRGIHTVALLLDDERLEGWDWRIRAMFDMAGSLGAHLVILDGNLGSRVTGGRKEGLAPDWVRLLLDPIIKWNMDLVVSRFNRHYLESPVCAHLVFPLANALYGRPVHDLVGAQWGVSRDLLLTYPDIIRSAGAGGARQSADQWLIAQALSGDTRLCEAHLGTRLPTSPPAETGPLARQTTEAVFQHIVANDQLWAGPDSAAASGLVQPPFSFGAMEMDHALPTPVNVNTASLVVNYRQGLNRFHTLYRRVLGTKTFDQLEALAAMSPADFLFPAHLYVGIVYDFLLAYASREDFTRGDLASAFVPLFEGHVGSFARHLATFKSRLYSTLPEEAERLVSLEARKRLQELAEEFIRQKPHFLTTWRAKREASLPPVPKVTYREFIPGVPLVVPLELTNPEGCLVTANGVYDSLFRRAKQQFEEFVYDRLHTPPGASSLEIGNHVRDFMSQVERELDRTLLPGDLHSPEGTRSVTAAIFLEFPREPTFALTQEMAAWLLRRHPPLYLLTRLGYDNLNALLREWEPRDVLALADWHEEYGYRQRLWMSIREEARREHFETCEITSLVVPYEDLPSIVETGESSALDKIAGRVVVSTLPPDLGGHFPKLRYLTTIAKNIIEAEGFGRAWRRFSESGKDLGDRVVNSLEGHWGRTPLSAHNMFENGHQRLLVSRLKTVARRLWETNEDTRQALAKLMDDMTDCYHLALALSDGGFVPCSAWTWASYSFHGGIGVPTPLSLFVERDWYSRDFLTDYFKATGGNEEVIDKTILDLMEKGRESEDLVPILLGPVETAEEVVPQPTITDLQPPAEPLTRHPHNPVLSPIPEHPWESRFVLNPAAVRLGQKVYLVYRASGDDGVSRLGLAVSEDGFSFTERLPEPIFGPAGRSEAMGCEDPRLTRIGDRLFMTYVAYDGVVAQIALASISLADFLSHRWAGWRRHGLVFPGFTDKNAALFPERFDGRFAMLHRVDPHIWINFSPHLRCPWPRKEHRILAGSGSGMAWDGNKVGAGAPPIKTEYGWLLVTHAADHDHVYRLGVMLLDLTDPTTVLYRSPNPILSPELRCELGEPGECWVPNVVFTCGAVPGSTGKEVLGADDEILVYYGAADTEICVAQAKVGGLIPAEIRHRPA